MTSLRAAQRATHTASTRAPSPIRPLRPGRSAPFQSSRRELPVRWTGGLSVNRMEAERDAALRGNSAGHTGLVALLYAEAAETALLSAEEERALLARAQAGDTAARDHLVCANIRLVGRVAQWYLASINPAHEGPRGIGRDDLVQDGCLGLLRAIETFDLSTSYRFSTYAVQWIRQAISRALDIRGLSIRLPVYLRTRVRQVTRLRAEIAQQEGAALSNARLAELLGMREEHVADALALAAAGRDPLSYDYDLTRVAGRPGGDGDPFTLADLLEDPQAEAALEAVEEELDRAAAESAPDSVTQIIARLKARRRYRAHRDGAPRNIAREMEIVERRVLRGQTFDEIARVLGITRQRVQQLEKKGIAAIREERARVRRDLARAQAQASGQPLPLRQSGRQRETCEQNEMNDSTEREQRAKGA